VIQPGQTILTMVDLSKLYLRGFVPEGAIGKVKVGQTAQVSLDSNPNESIPAEVIRVDPEAMFTPENTYFKEDRVKQVVGLKLGLRGGFGFAKPGMPADGLIQIGSQPQTQARAERR
jgi:HlyD family secretion protein